MINQGTEEGASTGGPVDSVDSEGGRTLCQHCKLKWQIKPRGLCYSCYIIPSIKDRYSTKDSRANNRGHGLSIQGIRPMPSTPTVAFPGSPRKIAVLEDRASRGEQLWHPDDLTMFNIEEFMQRIGIRNIDELYSDRFQSITSVSIGESDEHQK